MRINVLPKGTSVSDWFQTWDLLATTSCTALPLSDRASLIHTKTIDRAFSHSISEHVMQGLLNQLLDSCKQMIFKPDFQEFNKAIQLTNCLQDERLSLDFKMYQWNNFPSFNLKCKQSNFPICHQLKGFWNENGPSILFAAVLIFYFIYFPSIRICSLGIGMDEAYQTPE